jgi:hypothetical protein
MFAQYPNVATDAVDSAAQLHFSAIELFSQSRHLSSVTHLNAVWCQRVEEGKSIFHDHLIRISMSHGAFSGVSCLGSACPDAGKAMSRSCKQTCHQGNGEISAQHLNCAVERQTMNPPPKRRQAGYLSQALTLVTGSVAPHAYYLSGNSYGWAQLSKKTEKS